MLRISPPSHSIDDTAEVIYHSEAALDHGRLFAEREKLGVQHHPLLVEYYSGATRFSLTAKMTVPDKLRAGGLPDTVCMMDYIIPGSKPTRFEIRPVTDSREWILCDNDEASEYEFARRGLVKIHDIIGADGNPTTIEPPRDASGGIARAWLSKVLHGDVVQHVGNAVRRLSKNEVAVAEGKP